MKPGRSVGPRYRIAAAIAEALEPRQLLSGTEYLVNSLDDTVAADGVLTLREAIEAVNTKAPVNEAPAGSGTNADIIRFDPALFASGPGRIQLNGTELVISNSLELHGPGYDTLTIDAGAKSRVLRIANGVVTVDGLGITGGRASDGAGIQTSSTVTLSHVRVAGNAAILNGGGMLNTGKLTLTDSVVTENSAANLGGGLQNQGSLCVIANVTISTNTAYWGGGLSNAAASASIINSTVAANTATKGGGIYQTIPANMVNVTVAGNTADVGGGVYSDGLCKMGNTIVAANAASAPTDADVYSSGFTNSDYNVIGILSLSQAASAGSHTRYGSAPSPLNPMLGDLTELNGVVAYPLLLDSPAIDAGSSVAAVDASGAPLQADAFGRPRVIGTSVDIGAVEGVLASGPSVTYVVQSLADEIAADGVVTFREAFEAASLNKPVGDAPAGSYVERDQITFAAGVEGTIAPAAGSLAIFSKLTIVGPGADRLTLRGDGTKPVLRVIGLADAEMRSLLITGGSGGLYNNGKLLLSDVAVQGNSGQYGGVQNAKPGAMTLTGAKIVSNTASSGGGGIQNLSSVVMLNCTVANNSAKEGGGIDNLGILTAVNTRITANKAENGAGIFNYTTAAATITGGAISGGSATKGGGIYNAGFLNMRDMAFYANGAAYGGALYNFDRNAVLVNVTITGNWTGAGYGGAVDLENGGLRITNCTIANNHGGVYLVGGPASSAQIANTIIAGNTGSIGPDVYGAMSAGSDYNLIGLFDPAQASGIGSHSLCGIGGIPLDPMLGDLTEINGQLIRPLLPGSRALNAGSNALALDASYQSLLTDAVGHARIAGRAVDIGAVEGSIAPQSPRIYVVQSLADQIAADGVLTFREAFEAANFNKAVGDAPAGSSTAQDEITFAPGVTGDIAAGGMWLTIVGNLAIHGPGSAQLRLVGDGKNWVVQIIPTATAEISRLLITGGSGGIWMSGGRVTVKDAVITNNRMPVDPFWDGGGILTEGVSRVSLTNVEVSNNLGSVVGGIRNHGAMDLTNCVVIGNSAESTTLGGVWGSAPILIRNTIVAGNASRDLDGRLAADSGYNLFGMLLESQMPTMEPHTLYGSAVAPLDPKLGPLTPVRDNLVRPLLPGSPVLNVGSNALALDASGNPLLTDAAGQPRIAGGTVDIGAFEYQPQTLAIGSTEAKDTIELRGDESNFIYTINSDPALKMPRSLVTALRIDAQGGDELSFDMDLQATDLLIQSDLASRDQLLASISQAVASRSLRTSQADDLHGLAAILNQDSQGNRLYDTFAGTSADENSLLVKLTWNGDADLNGKLDGSDYFFIDKGYLSRNLPNPPNGYHNGDFDYNGMIDGSDYFLIDKAYLATRTPGVSQTQAAAFAAAPRSRAQHPSRAGIARRLANRHHRAKLLRERSTRGM